MHDGVWLSCAVPVQPARSWSRCHAEGRGFESLHPLLKLLQIGRFLRQGDARRLIFYPSSPGDGEHRGRNGRRCLLALGSHGHEEAKLLLAYAATLAVGAPGIEPGT